MLDVFGRVVAMFRTCCGRVLGCVGRALDLFSKCLDVFWKCFGHLF